jgi:hypothetical protein
MNADDGWAFCLNSSFIPCLEGVPKVLNSREHHLSPYARREKSTRATLPLQASLHTPPENGMGGHLECIGPRNQLSDWVPGSAGVFKREQRLW